MKRKLIYLFIALAATILPAHAQKFLNDALTLSKYPYGNKETRFISA